MASPERHFLQASSLYSQALATAPTGDGKLCAILLANRAACALALENYGDALQDADASLALDGSYTKVGSATAAPARVLFLMLSTPGVLSTRSCALLAGQARGRAAGLQTRAWAPTACRQKACSDFVALRC